MATSGDEVVLSRVLIPILGLAMWIFMILLPRSACRLPLKSWQKQASVLLLNIGIWGIFILQIKIMDRLAPGDAHGSYFVDFIFIEAGGGLILGFSTLFRDKEDRVKSLRPQ